MVERLVIVGAGTVAGRLIDELTARSPGTFDITLFGDETVGIYDRIQLSAVLEGTTSFERLLLHDEAWYRRHRIDVRLGQRVLKIDRHRQHVVTAQGETPYDRLVIATGSRPRVIAVPGTDLPGVQTYRGAADLQAIQRATQAPGTKVVVIGGGVLGVETAAALAACGANVTLIHRASHLMERLIDAIAGRLLEAALEQRGITVLCQTDTLQLVGDGHVQAVQLADGQGIEAELVILATGIIPSTELALDAGLECRNGILIDDELCTSDPRIQAIGECAEHDGHCYGTVAPLFSMAAVAAQRLAGGKAVFSDAVSSTALKVTGLELFASGRSDAPSDCEEITFHDPANGLYRRLIVDDNRITGVLLYGDANDAGWFFQLLSSGADITDLRPGMIFGPRIAQAPPLPVYGGRCSLHG
ncbi:MAG: FAD-dependent oxidoreductase [Pseudomonadota bacterium]